MNKPANETDISTISAGAPGNTVAMIGLILTLIAGVMCGVLFASASRLPGKPTAAEPSGFQPAAGPELSDPETFDVPLASESPDAETDSAPAATDGQADSAPAATDGQAAADADARLAAAELAAQRLQILLLASATAVLNSVGLVLSIIGLFVPDRPRAVAVCGTILSVVLFAGVFGVMAVGALMNPDTAMMPQ